MPYKLLGEEPPESEDIQLPPKTPAASPLPSPKEVGGVLRNFLVKIDFDMFFEREPPNLQGVILFGKLYIGVLFLK